MDLTILASYTGNIIVVVLALLIIGLAISTFYIRGGQEVVGEDTPSDTMNHVSVTVNDEMKSVRKREAIDITLRS